MSTAGQAAGGLVGGVIGFFVGGPTGAKYGAQIGITIGGYLDPAPGKKIEGPRLDDLSVQTATYGAVIPRVYGMVDVIGNVFWLENNQIKETVTKKKSGGKGGGSKTTTRTYSYSATFAVGLCKGPIVGVRRIWVGPELIYDAGSTDPGTIAASNASASGFTVYTGTDTQAPNARMQATLGAANTPAWRGLAYIVFYDLALEKYGNSLAGAQVKVEVFQSGSFQYYTVTQHDMPVARQYAFTVWTGSVFVRLAHFSTSVFVSADGVSWTEYPGVFTGSPFWMGLAYGNGVLVAPSYSAGMPIWASSDGIYWASHSNGGGINNGEIAFGNGLFVMSDSSAVSTSADGQLWTVTALPENSAGNGSKILFNGTVFLVWMNAINKAMTSPTGTFGWSSYSLALNNHNLGLVKSGVFFLGSTAVGSKVSSDGINWTTYSAMPYSQSAIVDDNNFVCFGNDSFATSPDGNTWTSYVGVLPGLGVYPYVAPSFNGSVIAAATSASSIAVTIQPLLVSPSGTNLAAIVSAESLSSGLLAAGDIDVSSLTATVRGYRVSSLGAIRAALDPLRVAWPFDCAQRGYKIVYVARGGASVGTIPAEDLDARADGSAPGIQITTSREMDAQLPRRVTINYLDVDREYDAGTQYAERLNTPAINHIAHDLPIVLTGTEGAGKAEVLLYLAWLERHDVSFKLPPTWNHLEPVDVVGLTTPEGVISVRLTAVNYTSDGRLECEGKYANAAIYTPTAVGASSAVTGLTTIAPAGPSVYHLLDLPLVDAALDSPSILVAMCGTLAGWPGGSVFQSTDAGATWASIESFPAPGSTIGTASDSIGAVEPRMIDKASRLTVVMTQGDLFDTTELAMLGGANHFAYGADGRWEIIAAQNCTLQTGTTYVLSNLLRGRFGTEQHMGAHLAGDALVLLDAADVSAVAMSSGAIGLARDYRGITSGADISSDSNRAFTYNGVNLKPLAPIALTGNRHPSSNDWSLTWLRRTRTGGEWRDNVDAALGEASEQYQVDVFSDGSYTSLKRTLSVTTPAATYSSADQVTDFGSNQATLYLKLYQMSAAVGRGFPLTTSITR